MERAEFALPDLAPLLEGQRAAILECLQWHLTQRWVRSERMKGQIGDWKRMRSQGSAEFAALDAFLRVAGAANRMDLARFVLRTNAALFTAEMTPAELAGGPAGQTQYMERVHTAALQRTSNALRAAEAAIVNPP